MTQKPVKTIRRTIVVVIDDDFAEEVPVSTRVIEWEDAAKTGRRRAHRVEYAGPAGGGDGAVYIIDLELECRGANRHDLTKFVHTYIPEACSHYITD